jgi:hypothetical protein
VFYDVSWTQCKPILELRKKGRKSVVRLIVRSLTKIPKNLYVPPVRPELVEGYERVKLSIGLITRTILLLVSLLTPSTCQAGFNFSSRTATITVAGGAFVINKSIPNYSGNLIQQGAVRGQPILFNLGVLETTSTPALFTGSYDGDATTPILLNSNQLLRIDNGQFAKSLNVLSTGNRLEGLPVFLNANAISLGSQLAGLTLAINGKLNTSIAMNGGTIILDSGLDLAADRNLTGSGTVNTQGSFFRFGGTRIGAELAVTSTIFWNDASELSLNGPIEFSGTWTFNAQTSGNRARIRAMATYLI